MPKPELNLPVAATTPRIEYRKLQPDFNTQQNLLAAIRFGTRTEKLTDPRCIQVGLKSLRSSSWAELWHANGATDMGFAGAIRYCADGDYLAGVMALDERDFGSLAVAAESAYATLRRFLSISSYPYALRIWNYLAGINQGAGDAERYKQFCVGRAAGFGIHKREDYPAATAIGRRDQDPILQVYWLASRVPGVPLENPRQVSAYRYPRQYGPVAPSFSRAMLVAERLLLISGTASIVGHASHHPGDLPAQVDEVLANLASLLQRARTLAPQLPAQLGATSLLKFYLRHANDVDQLETLLRQHLPAQTPYMILEADICRPDLLIEADCLHATPA